ncbi:nucleotidyltransferase family protein [Ectothiorhodospira sp. 9905]|uniref:nucleotidyltransferase domain-containing protein n=1 Tax=Ectothiorhodospira sp. 9905 TaxID=2897387 RepID=UPI001EE7B692|nr:nucleotidyltransferase family protein [Ectothiorhodospira sp. 9905]MCG5517324.1 nucleotidyltransferase family protein [Ectothiorhodospira sp. 9100]MCG5520019.1 nucleotidyltransferase family protein [Ectothiorhodospira sp. 9905]
MGGSPVGHLLGVLRNAGHVSAMGLADWDVTVRLARQARVLGMLGHRLRDDDAVWASIPERVRSHFQASINTAAYREQWMLMELRSLAQALPPDLPVTVLKGAAYVLQDLPLGRGRMPNDVDLLVSRGDLEAAEGALKAAGWQSGVLDPYDERYYREWSHELPPLRYPGHPLEVDLHHTIAPVTSRTRADDERLFASLQSIPDSRFLALGPQDQVLHAAIHLFQDSELLGELRGVVDMDALVRQHLVTEADWEALLEHAQWHQASRVLWYALHFCRGWLGTPVPDDLPLAPPPPLARKAMDWIVPRSCLPRIPDTRPTLGQRVAATAGLVRYHWLRMPPGLLARHLLHKSWVAVKPMGGARAT